MIPMNTTTLWLLGLLFLMIGIIKLFKVDWVNHEPRLIDKIICWFEYHRWLRKQSKHN